LRWEGVLRRDLLYPEPNHDDEPAGIRPTSAYRCRSPAVPRSDVFGWRRRNGISREDIDHHTAADESNLLLCFRLQSALVENPSSRFQRYRTGKINDVQILADAKNRKPQ